MASPTPRLRPLYELTRSRILEVVREPGVLFWIFGFPVLMAVVLGLAFRAEPVVRIPVAVVGSGQGAEGALAALADDAEISPQHLDEAEARERLRLGEVDVVLQVKDAESSEDQRAPYTLTYVFDPTRPQSRASRLRLDDALQRAAGRRDPARSQDLPVSEPGSRYIDFLIPGLIGLNVMGSSMWGLGFVVVMMRTRKTLKRLAATPMRRSDFLFSMMLSRVIFLVLELAFIVAFGWVAFGVEVRGSVLDLALISLLGSLSFTGLALLVAARPRSVEVASGWMNFVMMPMWLCSGSFFSYARFPEVVKPLIRLLPLTAINDALRSVMTEGAPLVASWRELLVLAAWGVLSFVVALRIFRWQ